MTRATNHRTLIVEWGDCDPAGIVFYPRYFAMFDTSTARLIEGAAGMRKADLIRTHGIVGWPMVKTEATFIAPATFGDEIAIVSTVTRVGRSSFEITHRMLRQDMMCIEAFEIRVWAAPDPHKPGAIIGVPIPPALADALQGG
jgi:4-hydroxybenzoyl-CoA thioesterase